MKDRQFVTPLLVRDGDATPLQRVPLDEHTFTEAQLQDLLFKHPQLIPVGEIEPIFDELQPLARELPVGGGLPRPRVHQYGGVPDPCRNEAVAQSRSAPHGRRADHRLRHAPVRMELRRSVPSRAAVPESRSDRSPRRSR